jgi:hypothetical protein
VSIGAGVLATLSQSPAVLAGTNSIPAKTIVAATKGGIETCQDNELVPAGTTALRIWMTGNVKPAVRVEVLVGQQVVATGTQESGWLGKVDTVPVTRVPRTIYDAQVCVTIDRAVEEIDLFGGPIPHPRRGEPAAEMRIEYLRPGQRSWWSLASSMAQRIGLGRAPSGTWTFLIALVAMALVVVLTSWTAHRRLGRCRITPSPIWMCVCIACLSAASWSIVTPPFQVTDEPSHFSYAQILAETGHLPRSHSAAFSREELIALVDLNQHKVRFNPAVGTISTAAEQQRLQHDLALPLSRVGSGAAVATPEPPLYYALQTIPYELASSGTLLDQLALMRLLSALMAGLTALFTYLFLREALPAVPWAWTIGALSTALAPLLGFISGAVNPDAMLAAVCAALFYTLARAFRHGLTPRTATAIGAVTATGLLTKLNFIGLTPGILLALLLLTRQAAHTSKQTALRSLAIALAISSTPVLLYTTINLLSNHPALGTLSSSVAGVGSHPRSLPDELSYIWQSYLPRLPGMSVDFPGVSTIRQLWFDRLVGLYGWLDTHFAGWVYNVALIPTGLIAALCLRELTRARVALRARADELLAYGAIAVGLLGLVGADSYLEFPVRTGAYSEPRYLLPLAVLFAAILALAARGAGRRWGPAVGTLIVLLILAHDIFSQLLVVGRYYG